MVCKDVWLWSWHRLDLAHLFNEPELFTSSKLVVQINGCCYPWSMAGNLLALYVVSGKEPRRQTIKKLQELFMDESKPCQHNLESVSKQSRWQWISNASSCCNEPIGDKDKNILSSGSKDSNDPNKLELKSITSAKSLKSQYNEPKAEEKHIYSHDRMFNSRRMCWRSWTSRKAKIYKSSLSVPAGLCQLQMLHSLMES